MPQKYVALFLSREVNLDSLLAGENHFGTHMLITEQLQYPVVCEKYRDREMVNGQ